MFKPDWPLGLGATVIVAISTVSIVEQDAPANSGSKARGCSEAGHR
jgi:hypothetical protein